MSCIKQGPLTAPIFSHDGQVERECKLESEFDPFSECPLEKRKDREEGEVKLETERAPLLGTYLSDAGGGGVKEPHELLCHFRSVARGTWTGLERASPAGSWPGLEAFTECYQWISQLQRCHRITCIHIHTQDTTCKHAFTQDTTHMHTFTDTWDSTHLLNMHGHKYAHKYTPMLSLYYISSQRRSLLGYFPSLRISRAWKQVMDAILLPRAEEGPNIPGDTVK